MAKFIFCLLATLLLTISANGRRVNDTTSSVTNQPRAAATCADDTLTDVVVEGFSPSKTAHVMHFRWAFVHTDTLGADWQIQGEVFRAWQTPQDFTVPLYRLVNAAATDFVFVISTTGNPPTVSGFQSPAVVAYVYSTQVCGSVPLLATFQAAAGDHWYTTDASEHDTLITNGWSDAGITAFVLPL